MHDTTQHAATEHAAIAAAAKSAPPVVVSGAMIAGVQMSDIVLWLTALFLVLQISHLVWRWSTEYFADRRKKNIGHKPERRK